MEAEPGPQARCDEPEEPVSAIQVALLVVIAALLIYYVVVFLGRFTGSREKFASKRAQEVHDRARKVFEEGGGDANYSKYKNEVPGADPVQYNDVRELFREGKMSPYSVQSVL